MPTNRMMITGSTDRYFGRKPGHCKVQRNVNRNILMAQNGNEIMETLELKNITKKYGKKHAVKELSLLINKGDVLGILGENGAGKSTTMSMIATLSKPDEGDILIDGESIIKSPSKIRKCMGYVPQDIALYPMLTGYENLKFFGKLYHLNRKEIAEALEKVTAVIGLSSEVLNKKVGTYSGGMKRRVNIGAALMHDPEIVIMDEPTVGIDVNSRKQIIDTIIELNKMGKTIIYTGHYLDEIEHICNKICFLREGVLEEFDTLDNILDTPEGRITLEQYYIGKVSKH